MGIVARKLLQYGVKVVKDNPDFGNPITMENTDFILTIGKGILKVGKEILF
jgi:hypothetical protein